MLTCSIQSGLEDGKKSVKYLCSRNPETLKITAAEVFDTFSSN